MAAFGIKNVHSAMDSHRTHQNFAEFSPCSQFRTNLTIGHINNVTESHNFMCEITIGGLVDFFHDFVNIFDAVFVGDDVEFYWHSAVD